MNARRMVVNLVVVCVAFLLVPIFAHAAPVKNTLEVSGWVPYWRVATGTADTLPNLQYITTVHPFGYTVAEDGTVYDTAVLTEEPWKSFIASAKAKKVRVIPTVMWGNGAAMHRILSNTEARIKLEDDITALAYENGWEGIDIDIEAKYAETKDYFSTFLRGLYQRMGKK
jgi:spore germination protein YaaH